MKRIGIIGGSFDPIHLGHLAAAQEVGQKLFLDKIIFIPVGTPAFKESGPLLASAHHRYDMCLLACSSNPMFSLSDIEVKKDGPCFTIDTLRELKEIYPIDKLFFIMGADQANQLHLWERHEGIFDLCDIVVVKRPGHAMPNNHKFPFIFVEDTTGVDISSTKIRQRLKNDEKVDYLVPDAVIRYMENNNLYQGTISAIKKRLEMHLSRPRYLHSLAVMDEAVKMAKHYKLDNEKVEKTRIAALLHDCAKNICNEMPYKVVEKICQGAGISLDPFFKADVPLAHGYAGVAVAQNIYGIEDREILDAIEHHIFGKPNMTMMEKIVYLADFIEPTRPQNDIIIKARNLAYNDTGGVGTSLPHHLSDDSPSSFASSSSCASRHISSDATSDDEKSGSKAAEANSCQHPLDKAMAFVLKFTVEKNRVKKRPVYEKSLEALDFYEGK
ncbi:MAG: nicotinate-nucleotide adenylyltransferase [Defluviitaleaceae bacterium]|nr:nicotinate-nucleotide adenylyltransferase [Defluviitaleaceae bacterium]